MFDLSTETVLPQDIDISNRLIGSTLRKSEKETIARNIIVLGRQHNNSWQPFSWEEYKAGCTHKVTVGEQAILNDFVKSGLLGLSNDKYFVRTAFIIALREFVQKEKEFVEEIKNN